MVSARADVLAQLVSLICALEQTHPVRVAIDGVDASGKTTLADELVPLIEKRSRPVIRASIDGFHNPRCMRYQRGVDSPEGYYRDSFNHKAILRELLIPLGPGGNRNYRRTVFDYQMDAPNLEPIFEAPTDAILLFDGVFLLRPGLIQFWDFSIFVDVDFKVSVPRAVKRDVKAAAGRIAPQAVMSKYNQRYVPGQKIYLAEANPLENAQVIVDNNDCANPRLVIP